MHITTKKEQFSIAYVHAVATVAGCSISKIDPDDDGIDLLIRKGPDQEPKESDNDVPWLTVQVKCTETDCFHNGEIRFPLKKRNYDKLRFKRTIPRILVLVIVPAEIERWLRHSEEALALSHCGYWQSLREMPTVDNTSTVTITIPRNKQFTVDALELMMQRIESGQLP